MFGRKNGIVDDHGDSDPDQSIRNPVDPIEQRALPWLKIQHDGKKNDAADGNRFVPF
ncbi:hypothetical protein D1872_325000 [compost metagenome]